MKTLYDMELSGNCYKVRLFMALLGEAYRQVSVDLRGGENRRETFLALNPRGEVPVLVDNDQVIWDSNAILVYLASGENAANWYPDDALSRARVTQWLAVASHEIHYGLAAARAIKLFGRAGDLNHCQNLGKAALNLLDNQLGKMPWLTGDAPTIADIACYPYVHTAEDGEVPLGVHRNVVHWCKRIEQLPRYVPMVNPVTAPAFAADIG